MILDDHLVETAELQGMRRLARLDRPKVGVVSEDIPGASCIWTSAPKEGGHRDLVRLWPNSGVALEHTLRSAAESTARGDVGVELRGAASSLAPEGDYLTSLGGRPNTVLPRSLMARSLSLKSSGYRVGSGLEVLVADDAATLKELRSVVAIAFGARAADDPSEPDVETDFFHAPGVMTYLAIRDENGVISTGSILIVDGVANVWSVATMPSARGRGAGSAIMRAACLEAAKRGARAATLRTTDELARPDGLYASVGFRYVGREHIWEIDDLNQLVSTASAEAERS